jgi:hypothetical protein
MASRTSQPRLEDLPLVRAEDFAIANPNTVRE